jgi:CarD family transcriptional regulator
MRTFKVGEPVVHLSHGVGEVVGIEDRTGQLGRLGTSKFYIIHIEDNGAPKKIFVPVENSANRLRPIMTKARALAVKAMIESGEALKGAIDRQTWNMRYREYMEDIHTGEPERIARVLVALRMLSKEKDLSFGERKLLDQAEALLRAEFEYAGVEL